MKKCTYLFAFFIIFLLACGDYEENYKTTELIYANDLEVDSWIKSNLKEINDYSLDDLLKEEKRYRKPIFSAVSSENKARLVSEKLDYVLTKDWLESQILYIEDVKAFVTPNLYETPEKFEKQIKEFLERGATLFSRKEIFYITMTIEKSFDDSDLLPTGGGCECATEWPDYEPCQFGVEYCNSIQQCEVSLQSCGFMSSSDCDGMCFPISGS